MVVTILGKTNLSFYKLLGMSKEPIVLGVILANQDLLQFRQGKEDSSSQTRKLG